MSSKQLILYFGCGSQPGHYLFHGTSLVYDMPLPGVHRDLLRGHLDGTFAPPSAKQCVYRVSIVPPLMIIAWNDYSVDKRPNSNSNFLFYGFDPKTDPVVLLAEAAKQYPWVIERQKQPLTPEIL